MSLLQPIRGVLPLSDPSPEAVVAGATRLCDALLAHNRLRPEAVVAARLVAAGTAPGAAAPTLAAVRAAGWTGIPLFFTRTAGEAPSLEVEAHVRLKRRRRLRPLELS